MVRSMNDAIQYESRKIHKKEHLAQVVAKEKDILSRTVFVTNAKDLNNPNHVRDLERFFQSEFGPVETFAKTEFRKRRSSSKRNLPPGRVRRIRHVGDARSVFDGKDLFQAPTDADVVKVDCTVGHRGSHYVRPSEWYRDMLEGAEIDVMLRFQVVQVALGHWFPEDEDPYTEFVLQGIKEGEMTNRNESIHTGRSDF